MLHSAAMEDGEQIDVTAILAQLRAEIQGAPATATGETAHLALGVDIDELRNAVAEVEALRAVSAHWPIQGRTPRDRAAAFVQRLIRRGLQWYIQPIVQQQNSYNAAVAHALQLLLEAQLELAREIVRLRAATSADPEPAPDNASG
jgi:hypothetical protein